MTAILESVKSLTDPFRSTHSNLQSISSGAVADEGVQESLLRAETLGEQRLSDFMNRFKKTREEEDSPDKQNLPDFFSTIKSAKLKTLAQSKKRKQVSAGFQGLKSDRSLFAQLLLVARERDVDMKKILEFSLSPIPGSLSSHDGTSLSKTTKSQILHHLEDQVPECKVADIPSKSAVVVDAMALIQALPKAKIPATYGQLSDVVLDRLIAIAKQFNAERVDLVGDRYDDISIKGLERTRREQSGQHYHIASPDQRLPVQWKKFLSSGKNKQALQAFIADHMATTSAEINLTVVVALTSTVKQLQLQSHGNTATCELPHLTSDHEEADTRLILHANDCTAVGKFAKVIIWSPDTDVAIIATEHSNTIPGEILFATGTGKHQRLINLTTIAVTLGPVAKHLTVLHALSGCDTTSCFHGKGKKSIFNIAKKNEEHLKALALIGINFGMITTPPGIELLVCELYGAKSTTVNEARYELFRGGNSQERCLPPNLDALTLHVKRANYQAKVWRSALKAVIDCPSPDGQGWKVVDGIISVHWLEQPYAPAEVLQTKRCSCSKGCKSGRCSCIKAFLVCTALCGCVGCENSTKPSEEDSDDGDESDEVDD